MSVGITSTVPTVLPVLPPGVPAVSNGLEFRLFTADEYQRMVHAGLFPAGDVVEYRAGWVLCRPPEGGPLVPRPFSVPEYHQLLEIGVLRESEPVELLEGWVVEKMSRNTPHDATLDKSEEALRAAMPRGWRARSQRAITVGGNEPEPDFAIVSGDVDAYRDRHPGPSDIAFLVEVAVNSLATDRQLKVRLYASAAIPVYWIVNVPDRQVEVYSDPTDPPEAAGYRSRQDFREADAVPVIIRGQEVARIAVADLLPRV
jgi:Uma2 family endonuclease